MSRSAKRDGGATRNPERSRERILSAALKEFAAKGFAGARVDVIARRAVINKRMLYHYFGDKKGLFRAVLRRKIAERTEQVWSQAADAAEGLPLWFAKNCEDTDWIRLLAWESLQTVGDRVLDEPPRRRLARNAVSSISQQQKSGRLNPAFAPEHLQLALTSLAMFPPAFPQIAKLITGKTTKNREFQREYQEFLKQFALAFRL